MFRSILSLVFVLTSLEVFGQKQECYEYLKNYSPASLGMLKLIESAPSKHKINGITITLSRGFKPESYFRGRTKTDKISSLNTVIHESHHEFNSAYAYVMLSHEAPEDYEFGDEYSAFYYADDDIILLKHTEIFNSNELKKDIPKELQSFRYKPYITPKSNLGSQVQGIYGLMDEFHSYYLGTKTSMETFTYYEEQAKTDLQAYLDFISNISSSLSAFYEFKYFCLKYLQRARSEYPDIYEELMKDKKLRLVYTKTTTAFDAFVSEFHLKEKQIMKQAQAAGLDSQIDDQYFWIGNRGVGNRGEKSEALIAEMNKPGLLAIHQAFLLN